ncbi:MAG: hydrogenase maturation protease [Verrucomicrobia bacterium]|nr:hydrogenase maturation protease [Verrucomicrobiota bacterium]
MGKGGRRVLVIGYGNPGRLDDGLGPAFARELERAGLPGVTVDADYQLAVEDAQAVAEHEVVVFVDASLTAPEPFTFRRIEANAGGQFSSHIVEPEGVLALAQQLFGATTEAYVLGIRGYVFDEFGETISEQAQANLAAALAFLERVIGEGSFSEAAKS